MNNAAVTPVHIAYHQGPIKDFFKSRAQTSHVVCETGAKEYAVVKRINEDEMEAIARDLRFAYNLAD